MKVETSLHLSRRFMARRKIEYQKEDLEEFDNIRANITQLAREKGMALYALSQTADVDYGALNEFINRRHQNPEVYTLMKIARALGVPTSRLFEVDTPKHVR